MSEIVLMSSDGEKFTIPSRVAHMSELVRMISEDSTGECPRRGAGARGPTQTAH
jgi:hypothetical protein